MNRFSHILCICFLITSFSVSSQNQKYLEKKRKRLLREIKKVETILSKTKKKKKDALGDLRIINKKINFRENLIEIIKLETKELEKNIEQNQSEIEQNNIVLTKLKKDYSNMVTKSYKSKSQQSKTMFILSSKSFYQAYKRLKYLDQYKKFRLKQGQEIITKTALIENLNDSLIKVKTKKKKLLANKEKQKKEVEKAKKEQEKVVAAIKKQENKYKRELKKKLKEEKKVSKKIDEIIRNAIASANKKRKGAVKKTSKNLILSKEEESLKVKFEQNKGRLPWPVDGIVTRKFGIQAHPTFKKIKINSTGLHIRAKENDEAKAIFKGKVLAIHLLSKGRKSVFIQHGNYITTYTNLEDVYVKTNDNIKIGDPIGKIFTDKATGKTLLQFILSKNTTRLNPQKWLKSK